MPVIYETTATIAQNGHLMLDVADLPFDRGTQFLVKLIPQATFDAAVFKQRMRAFMRRCAEQNPFQGMSKTQILTELRRQREEMYGESDQNQS